VQVPAISKHLKKIFETGELNEKVVVSILESTTQHGAIKGKTQTLEVCPNSKLGGFVRINPIAHG
jgi:hypothetical protein